MLRLCAIGTSVRSSTARRLESTSRETGILRTKGFDTESGVQQVLAKPPSLSFFLSLCLFVCLSVRRSRRAQSVNL